LYGTSPDATDEHTPDVTNQIQKYFFLKFPFELFAGYNLALNVAFLNIIMHKIVVSAVFNLVLASVSLVLLLCVGCYVAWTKKGLCMGAGAGLAWYLVSIVCNKNVAASLVLRQFNTTLYLSITLHYETLSLEYSFSSSIHRHQS